MTNHQLDEEAIFHIARQLDSSEARATYLAQVCIHSESLRHRVEALLAAHEQQFLKSTPPDSTADFSPISESPGTSIDRYRLMEQIGEGGMGVVFVAEQDKPIRRKVALKVVKPGMDSKAVIARFEAERQALALMDHPNIAKVLDAGTTESGRPYFVMELIRGIPITDYCDQNKLTIPERLQLFVQVCHAIQHAHQKGIIHRDIKPSNVLVTLHDGNPIPKVIDFGVAKALNTRLTDKTIYTEHLQIIGTLLYMSPEQAELSGLDIDTRSDVYSLGVLMYELLTGTTPFQKDELDKAGLDEQRRLIRETEPPRASARISSLGETATTIAEYRRTDPQKLGQLIRGDLDWIVLKALEKDRGRRYESPHLLAADVSAYMCDDIVHARPPSTQYRLKKLLRRNRALTATLTSVFFALTMGLALALWGWNKAREEATRAETASQQLENKIDELQTTQQRLQATVLKWHRELIDRGIEAALRGDTTATQEIVKKAETAEVPGEWRLLLEGLAHNFSDDSVKAGISLRQAYDEDPDNLAVAASLLMTRSGEGSWNQNEWEQLARSLMTQEPAGDFAEYETLFLGWAKLYIDPTASMHMIQQAIASRETFWPIATLFLAHAEAHVAIDSHPHDLQLGLLAIEHATEAENALDSNPFSKSINAWARIMVMPFVRDSDPSKYTELREECRTLVKALRGHEAAVQAAGLICMFYDMVNDPEAEQTFLELAREDWWGACRTAYLYQHHKLRLATDILPDDIRYRPFAAITKLAIEAIEGNGDIAMRGYEELKDAHASAYVRAFAIQIPVLAAETQVASDDASMWLDTSDVHNWPFFFAASKLQYFANRSTQEKLLDDVRGSRLGQCYAHYAIGISLLGTDPNSAGHHLRECLKTNLFWCPEYYMARALLARHPELHEKDPPPTDAD